MPIKTETLCEHHSAFGLCHSCVEPSDAYAVDDLVAALQAVGAETSHTKGMRSALPV